VEGAHGAFCRLEGNLFGFGTAKANDYDGMMVCPHYGKNVDVGRLLRLGTKGSMLLKYHGTFKEHVEVRKDLKGFLASIAAIDKSKILCIDVEKGVNGIRLICFYVPFAQKVHVLDLLEIGRSGAIRATRFILRLVLASKDIYGFDLRLDEKWLMAEGFLDSQGFVTKHDLRSSLARFLPEIYTRFEKNVGYVTPFGLTDILRVAFGLSLDKSLQNSDWDAIELTEQQLLYASLDAYAVGMLVEHFVLP